MRSCSAGAQWARWLVGAVLLEGLNRAIDDGLAWISEDSGPTTRVLRRCGLNVAGPVDPQFAVGQLRGTRLNVKAEIVCNAFL